MSDEPVRYFVVDVDTKTIIDGPSLWVGPPQWEHPLGTWMPEADALADGYTWTPPPQENPPEPEPEPE